MAKTPETSAPDARKARLAEALRANLKRRKAQARARSGLDERQAEAAPDGPKGPAKD